MERSRGALFLWKTERLDYAGDECLAQFSNTDRSTKRMRHVMQRLAYFHLKDNFLFMPHAHKLGMIADKRKNVSQANLFFQFNELCHLRD